jgi:paraquat-inducible protein A
VTMAKLVSGPRRMIGPAMIILLAIFPIVLFVPLLQIRAYFVTNEIVLLRVAHDLFFADPVLFVIVFGFGIVLPTCKMIANLCCWYFVPVDSWAMLANKLAVLGKLSMLDIILIALVVIAVKGVGVGTIRIQPGLHLYSVVVISSYLLNLAMNSTAQMLFLSRSVSRRAASPGIARSEPKSWSPLVRPRR